MYRLNNQNQMSMSQVAQKLNIQFAISEKSLRARNLQDCVHVSSGNQMVASISEDCVVDYPMPGESLRTKLEQDGFTGKVTLSKQFESFAGIMDNMAETTAFL